MDILTITVVVLLIGLIASWVMLPGTSMVAATETTLDSAPLQAVQQVA